MCGGGGGEDFFTTTQLNEPWAGVQNYLRQGYGAASDLYNTGGPEYYPFSTVTPFSAETELGLGAITQRALQGSPVTGEAQNYLTNLMSGSGAYPGMGTLTGQQTAMNPYLGALSGRMGQINPYLGAITGSMGTTNLAQPFQAGFASGSQAGQNPVAGSDFAAQLASGQFAGAGPGYDTLRQTAGGDFLNANPYLDRMFETASEPVVQGVNSLFTGAGRYGSGAHQETMGDSLGDLANQIYGQNYARERGLQQQAAMALPGLSQADRAQALQGLGMQQSAFGQDLAAQLQGIAGLAGTSGQDLARQAGLAQSLAGFGGQDLARQAGLAQSLVGTGAQDLVRQLQAASQLGGNFFQNQAQQLQGAALSPTLANQDYFDLNQLMNVGGQREQLGQQQLADSINRFNFEQFQPYENLNVFLNQLLAAPGGSMTQTQPIFRDPASGFLGGALGTAGAVGNFGMQDSPWMWPLIFGGGLLGSGIL